MTAVYFRVLDAETKQPTGHIGFACAQNNEELLWAIDEFCDPYSVEVKTAYKFAMCLFERDSDGDGDDGEALHSEWEVTERLPFWDDTEGWRKPAWCKK